MAAPVNLAHLYLQDGGVLPGPIWVMEGTMPYPEWPAADAVFVINPPPLDIPLVADVWTHGRTLIMVSTILPQGLAAHECHPLSEFFGLPAAGEVLTHLRQRQCPVLFLSFQRRRPWYLNWLPTVERDALVVEGSRWVFRFEEYVPYEGSFEFDDTYRRLSLRECTFAQSTAHFLHVLETLPWTAVADPLLKRTLFQGIFPFYTGAPLRPEVPFDWRGAPDALPRAILSAELRTHTVPYALALACLSEVAAAFTHRGRHDLYQSVMGAAVRLQGGQVKVGAFTPEQVQWLRRTQPLLYLHVFYRVPNQCLVATVDAVRDGLQHTAVCAAAEALLQRVVTREADLQFVKRTYEVTALAGTLCQLHTFAARFHGDRPRLLAAKEEALRAVQHARPDDVSRDLNYWILAVLTDWVLFPTQAAGDPATTAGEYTRVVAAVQGYCQHELDNTYNLMVTFLAAAVDAACRPETQIRALLRQHGLGPPTLTAWFQQADYDACQVGNYAMCLAVGYAALLCPVMGWPPDSLAFAMAQAHHFFYTTPHSHSEQTGVILRIVALKYAACQVFSCQTRADGAGRVTVAETSLATLQALVPHLGTHATLTTFFTRAREDVPCSLLEVLRVIFTLPY